MAARTVCAFASAAAVWLSATIAQAYEDQVTLGAELGYAEALGENNIPDRGPQLGLSTSVGLNDVWSLRGRFAYAYHPGNRALHVGILGAEVLYLLDVLEVVPYFGAGLDGLATVRSGDVGGDFAAHAVVGIDWLVSWDWTVGLDIRPYILPLELDDNGVDPVYLTITARVSYNFDL